MDLLLSYLHSGVSAVVPFIVLLGLLIFVHELGHFLVAKFFGVRVEIFSLGFGKKILKYKRGDTTYCISLIPLGGYVKMFGDDITAQIPEEEKKYSFTHKPVAQRIGVVLAGPLMNFFFAVFVLFIVAMIGEQVKSPVVGDIAPASVAYQSGFRSGDKILKADGKTISTWDQFVELLTEKNNSPISVLVQRQNSDQEAKLEAVPHLISNPNLLSLQESIGDIDGLSTNSKATVVGVKPQSVAAQAGLRTGDFIKSIAGRPVRYFRDLDNIFVSLQGQPISLDIERYKEGNENPETFQLQIPGRSFASIQALGLESADLYLAKIVDNSPAKTAGLKEGDRIIQVNEVVPTRWEDVLNTVKSFSGTGTIHIQVERDGQPLSFEISPTMSSFMNVQGAEEKRYTVGIVPWAIPAPPEIGLLKADNVFAGLQRGFKKTVDVSVMTVVSFLRLVQNKISPKNIGGVIAIGQAASETFKSGLSQYLQMMAFISINLFILNLLPIPVLDGGHLLFYTIEALRGAPLSMRKMEIAQQIGLVLLMSLMVFSLFNDVTRVFGIQ
ncbi:MAG: RIP metalloprotease RseP [Bdellovibrio sp. CG10_big_fil_rev_8_21_14_0_10_47_8]|nr:MAG: RIP metalloprotease RseP [Bdellovibrio sp. CG10_big_fil_rev_8_21_14_0_10_47_8]